MTIDRHRAETVAFWALAALHLVPVWSFRYVPTQDGPSHLNNAQIIKDCRDPAAESARVFEVRLNALPNLSSHLLLAGLMYVVPPLVAEKLLVTGYVLGFAGSFRYFLGAFGPDHRPLSWAGLLFVFNRCFWMGFYNYCLSLVLFWTILGYVWRRRNAFHAADTGLLLGLFLAAYFTHLAGYVVAVAGAVLVTVLAPPRRMTTFGLVLLAALPSVCLTMNYFEETGFARSTAAMRVVHDPLNRLGGNWRSDEIEKDLTNLDAEVFAFHAGRTAPLGTALLIYLVVLTMVTVAIPPVAAANSAVGPGPLFPTVFGVLLVAAYLFVPDHLGGGNHGLPNGGFLKARLALLPPMLWLACIREPNHVLLRLPFRVTIVALVAVNLWLVTSTVRDVNRELSRYTAGVEAVGHGHTISAPQPARWPSPFANPLVHAADYYCLGTGNVNVHNYEAHMPHFPVKFRTGFEEGRGGFDILICWQSNGPVAWEEIFSQSPLRIYRRPPD
jgi:hypothetical protein